MTTATVGLVMIVRNEALTLPRLAASLEGQVDRWTIVDTGSIDDTVGVVSRVFDGVPGVVIKDRWRGFGPSRNVALDAAEPHTDWLLTMDADETFGGQLEPAVMEAENTEAIAVEAECRYGDLRYWLPRLVRSGAGWRWHGRAHEYLAVTSGATSGSRTDCFWVEHHGDGGNRADKFEREIALLKRDWAEDPGDARTVFYLARSFDDLGRDGEAVEWYRSRVSLNGWDEENWYAHWRLGACLLRTGSVDEGCGMLWRAWGERPWRAEPLVELAEHYRNTTQWELAWQASELAFRECGVKPDGSTRRDRPDRLFVDSTATEWRAAYEASISAWYVGHTDRGRRYCDYLLRRHDLPESVRAAVQANQRFYRP